MITCLKAQTVDVSIILWDNGVDEDAYPEDERLDLHVRAGRNLGCFPRWWLASLCTTPYLCSLDDDLLFRDTLVIQDAMVASKTNGDRGVVGMFGWTWVPGRSYKASKHYMYGVPKDTYVDVVKGRFMLFATELMRHIPCYGVDHPVADDIFINMHISEACGCINLLPTKLSKRWMNMSQRGAASLGGHYNLRDDAVRNLLETYGKEGMTRYAPSPPSITPGGQSETSA